MVVRGTGRLREETRQSVRESMDRLGYVYHRGAASLRTRRSGLLGLLTTDISNPFFAVLAQGFEQAAAEGGYLTIMTNTFDNPTRQARLAQSMIEFPIDALAYTPVASADLAYRVQEFPVPILALTRGSSAGAPYLGPDDVVGGRLAGQHLIEHHGYRRIFYLGGPRGASPREDRLRGLKDVAARNPDARIVGELEGTTNVAGGIELARTLLDSGAVFDAVVCHSDVVAYALLSALRGVDRIGSVGVIGFDGLPESQIFWPPVTSVAVGPELLGREAARWLLRELAGDSAGVPDKLSPHLEVRASCGCPPDGT
jgi:LacI family transcriptional regulator